MKKLKVLLLAICFAVPLAFSMKHFWHGKVLSESEVLKRWGSGSFDSEKFKSGSLELRSSMAYSLLKNQKRFVGKYVLEIRKELGDPDGYYFKDVFPAYIISEGKTLQDETWQIVFLLNQTRHVEKIIVHKNCCN